MTLSEEEINREAVERAADEYRQWLKNYEDITRSTLLKVHLRENPQMTLSQFEMMFQTFMKAVKEGRVYDTL